MGPPSSPALRGLRVGIVGGGIGGLHAAAVLARAGADVEVFEQAGSFADVGAGIQLSPNATRLLARLGDNVWGAVERVAVRPEAIVQRRWADGTELSRLSLHGVEEAFGAPYLHVHRADLADLLRAAVPASALHVGIRVVAVATAADGAALTTADGHQHTYDLVIGADGIHSVVRRFVVEHPVAPRFSGHVAYRALIPGGVASELGFAVDATNWMGPAGHVVHYFVRAQTMFNVVAVTTGEWAVESWTEPGDPGDLRAAFAGWAEPLCRLLGRVTHTHRWALFDRDPLPSWTRGRVTLLGDACHPMLPYLAQGGAQAIEDGAALVGALSISGSVDDALRAYELARVGRTTGIVVGARRNGVTYHLPDGDEQMARDRRLMAERPAPGGPAGASAPLSSSPLAGIWAHDAAVIPA